LFEVAFYEEGGEEREKKCEAHISGRVGLLVRIDFHRFRCEADVISVRFAIICLDPFDLLPDLIRNEQGGKRKTGEEVTSPDLIPM
jgi:hypothetical protein